jgi:hypothetical protein
MAVPRSQTADAVSQVHAIHAACALDRPMADGEHDAVTAAQRDDLGSRLHSWSLLGQHELPTGEVVIGFGEQNRHLEWKDMVAVHVPIAVFHRFAIGARRG